MQRSSRAPELSATRSRDSCWITRDLPSLRCSHDLLQAPALHPRDRPCLDDLDEIADLRLVRLVVGVEFGAPTDDLLVPRVDLDHVHTDDDRLVGRRGDDRPLAFLATPSDVLGLLEAHDRPSLVRLLARGLRPLP